MWQAWEAICQLYFPGTAQTAGGVKYLVRREAYRGMPPGHSWEHKPDVVVVKLSSPTPGPDGFVRSVKRDILWVECKAPCHDQPGAWETVMSEAVGRLASAHPDRNVWLVLATGLKWMVFYWNPRVGQNPPLSILSHDQRSSWPVDQRICVAPVGGQRHIVNGNIIRTDLANTLDFTNLGPNNVPTNMNSCLLLLEAVIATVQAGNYNATNPATMT